MVKEQTIIQQNKRKSKASGKLYTHTHKKEKLIEDIVSLSLSYEDQN